MPIRITSLSIILTVVLVLSGCLMETETAIRPDPQIDHRLEGVWQLTERKPNEIRDERDDSGIGIHGYIIIAKLDGHGDTYKAIAFDSFEADSPSKFPEMLVSTRRHRDHDFLLVRLPEHEKKKTDDDKRIFKNWVVDYKFNEAGELLLQFLSVDDFDEIQKVHPIKFDHVDQPFAPITLKGDDETLLDLYTDPKIHSLLTSMGKYRKLVPQQPPNREQHSGQ